MLRQRKRGLQCFAAAATLEVNCVRFDASPVDGRGRSDCVHIQRPSNWPRRFENRRPSMAHPPTLQSPHAFLGAHEAVTQMFSQVPCQSNAALNCEARMSITETAMSDNCCFMGIISRKNTGAKRLEG